MEGLYSSHRVTYWKRYSNDFHSTLNIRIRMFEKVHMFLDVIEYSLNHVFRMHSKMNIQKDHVSILDIGTDADSGNSDPLFLNTSLEGLCEQWDL